MEEFRHGPATILAWVLAVGAVAWLLQNRIQNHEYAGIAIGKEYPLSSATDAHVVSVVPELGEEVKAGDVVVTLNSAALEAEMKMVQAEVDEAKALLEVERIAASTESAAERSDWQREIADLEAQVERYRADALTVRVEIESDRVEEKRLALDVERTREMLARAVGSREEYDNARALHERMVKRIEESLILMGGIEENQRKARERLDEWSNRVPPEISAEPRLSPYRELIRAREREVDTFRAQIDDLVLRAPADGRVSQMFASPGKGVAAAETILVIREPRTTQVIGYIPEADPAVPRMGDRARVVRANNPSVGSDGVVLRVGASVEMTPIQMWFDPGRPEYGRCVVIRVDSPEVLTPGEKVRIRVEP